MPEITVHVTLDDVNGRDADEIEKLREAGS